MKGGVKSYEKKKKILPKETTLLTPTEFEYPMFGEYGEALFCYAGEKEVTCDICSLVGSLNCPINRY